MSGISSASLIDLKAELFRKQEEFKKQKLSNASTNYIRGRTIEKKTTVFSRKNAGVAARAQKDLIAKNEEEDLHEKSRKTLEAKSKLYEQITQTDKIPNEDENPGFLVDFQKKAIDKFQDQQNKKEEINEDEFVDSPSNPDEKWVEYTDSLGRTRTCMKKDLDSMQKRDKELGILPKNPKQETNSNDGNKSNALSSQEIYCQMLRDKWNKEEEEAQSKPVGPVHYENVRCDEIRTHGVGYYQFSKDEQERRQQMGLLSSIRDQTKKERNKRNLLKEKRENLMAARLKKIKDRQRAKMGLAPEEEVKEEPNPDPVVPDIISSEVKYEAVPKTSVHVREWDFGKDKFWESEKKYFKERHEERDSEFAPPSFYYSSNSTLPPKRKSKEQLEYTSTPAKKSVFQKLKKVEVKKDVKEANIKDFPVVPDLSKIPLPEGNPNIKATNDNSAAEHQLTQPENSSMVTATSLQTWNESTAMTTQQYNAMYAAAFNNQLSTYPINVTTTADQHSQMPLSNSVNEQIVVPEKPKPTIIDIRYVKNVETLENL